MTPGEKLRALRHLKGVNQEEMAVLLNGYARGKARITRATYANWETDRNEPKWQEAKIIVRYFKITLDDLFFEEKTAFLPSNVKRKFKQEMAEKL